MKNFLKDEGYLGLSNITKIVHHLPLILYIIYDVVSTRSIDTDIVGKMSKMCLKSQL